MSSSPLPDTPGSSLHARELAVATAVFVVVVALQVPFLLHFPVLMDEGGALQMGDDVRMGKLPYRDASSFAFPAVYYLLAVLFAIFEPSILVGRALVATLFATATATAYLIARWSFGRRGALLVALLFVAYRVWAFPHWHMPNYSTLAMTLALLGCWLAGEAVCRRGGALLVLAGSTVGLAVLAKQDVGLASFGCLATTIGLMGWKEARSLRKIVLFACGAALPLSATFAAFAAVGGLDDLIWEGVIAPLYIATYLASYTARPSLWPLFSQDLALRQNVFSYFPPLFSEVYGGRLLRSALYRDTVAIDATLKLAYHLPWLLLVAGAPFTLRRFLRSASDPAARRELVLLALATAAALAFNKPNDWVHLFVLYPPTILYAAALTSRWRNRAGTTAAAALAVGTFAAFSAVLALQWRAMHSHPIRTPRGATYARLEQAAALQQIVDLLVADRRATPLMAMPYHPMLNFLSAAPTPTRYYAIWPWDIDPQRDQKVIDELIRNPEVRVVYSPSQFLHFPPFSEFAPKLYAHLVEFFEVDRVAGGDFQGFTFLLLRRQPPAAGASLIDVALREARTVVRSAGGRQRPATGEDAAALLTHRLWPFLPVLAPLLEPEGEAEISLPIAARAGERFEVSYGVHPDRWPDPFAPRVSFRVAVRDGDRVQEIVAEELDPPRRAADRPWRTVSLDLTPWADRSIELVLTTRASGGTSHPDLAAWGDPRLVSSGGR